MVQKEVFSLARKFKLIAPYIEPLFLGMILVLISLNFITLPKGWITPILLISGIQLMGASFFGHHIRGLITPEIKNPQCPKCGGFFITSSLKCKNCGASMDFIT